MIRQALLFILLTLAGVSFAQDRLQPYLLIDNQAGALAEAVAATQATLADSDFTVVGDYAPFDGAHVIAITHPALLDAAGAEEFGGFGAVLRVGITEVDGMVQRSVANPAYWGVALHIGELAPVSAALAETFGDTSPFGSERGLAPDKLAKYRYMMMMPRLRDHDELGSFANHEEAVATIRANLAASNDLSGVFEVAVPGRDEVLFGVGIGSGDGADATVMATTDQEELRHTAHLPYALLVSGDTAYALAGKFRIALAFPDLGMGTFMKISGAPNAIRDSLGSVAQP